METQTRFDLREVTGRSVAVAWDNQLERTVALKTHPRTPESTDRVRAILSVAPHPNLALIRDDTGDAHAHRLVMDFVEGRSLQDLRDAGDLLSSADALQCAADVNAALAHLHQLEPPVAHGDVKPCNVMITERDGRRRAVLVDVGLGPAAVRCDIAARRAVVDTLLARPGAARRRALAAGASGVALILLALGLIALSRAPERHHRFRSAVHQPSIEDIDDVIAEPAPDGVTTLAPGGTTSALRAAPSPPSAVAALVPAPARAPARSRLAVYWHSVKAGSGEYPAYVDVYHLDRGDLPQLQHSTYGAVPQFTHIVALNPGWNLCYGTLDGVTASVPISRDGVSDWGERLEFQPGFTQVVGDGHGLAWLYRADTGAVETIRFGRDGYHTHLRRYDGMLAAGFDRSSALGADHALFYASKSGRAVIVTGAPDATITRVDEVTLPADLAVLMYPGRGYLVGVHSDGTGTVYKLTGARLDQVSTFSLGGSGWNAGSAFDHGFVVYPRLGLHAIYTQLDPAGHVSAATNWTLPALPIVYEVPGAA